MVSSPPADLLNLSGSAKLLPQVGLLPSPSSLGSAHDRPINRRRGVEAGNTTLFRKLADQEHGGLVSQNNHLIGVWVPVSFIEQRRGGDEEVK